MKVVVFCAAVLACAMPAFAQVDSTIPGPCQAALVSPGVPSAVIPGEGSDTSWRLRSVAEARPLIAAARSHAGYRSTILVPLTGADGGHTAGGGDPCRPSSSAAARGCVTCLPDRPALVCF